MIPEHIQKNTFLFFIRERYEDQDIPFCRPLHGFHLSTGWNEMFWQPGLWNMAKGLNNSNDLDSWLRLEKTGLPLFWLCVWPVWWRSPWRQDPRWRSPRVHLPMWRESVVGHCHNGYNNHIVIVATLSQMFSTLQYQFSLLHSSSTRSAVATTWSSIEVTSLTKIATSLDLDICRNRWLFFIQSKLDVWIEWQS